MKPQHHVPAAWSPEQALAVIEWLQGFIDTLWEVHGDRLVELLSNRDPLQPDHHRQMDFPF